MTTPAIPDAVRPLFEAQVRWGMTHAQMAHALGVKVNAYYQWLDGTRAPWATRRASWARTLARFEMLAREREG